MASQNVVLFDTQYVPATETEMFASPDSSTTMIGTIVDKMTATNLDTASRTVTVRLVPPDGTPTGTEFVVVQKTINAGQAYLFPEIVGQLLAAGGSLRMDCDAADVVVTRASGRNFTT